MHCYKRDLSPIREGFAYCNPVAPYSKLNTTKFNRNIIGNTFNQEILNLNSDIAIRRNKELPTFAIIKTKTIDKNNQPLRNLILKK